MADSWSQDTYIKAYKFAARAHWNQKMKQLVPGTNIPYLMHFSFVAMEVIAALEKDAGLDGNLAVQCALLHDTLEDTGTTYDQLFELFGAEVADGVAALTKGESIGENLSKGQKKRLQMVESLEMIKKQPKEIWVVKMADRITNLQPPPPHWTQDKINRYREEACEIYEALKEGDQYLSKRLKEKIEGYH
ncbi:MAG TPA: HD domain-containing protein [Desulfatiglandales bacterium]|nr:HD domain-containing protein [Desulfatiglandales bacterium]